MKYIFASRYSVFISKGWEQFRKTEVKIAKLEPNDSQVLFM